MRHYHSDFCSLSFPEGELTKNTPALFTLILPTSEFGEGIH